LEHHGGHAAAAGFTVNNANLPELVERLQLIAEQELSQLDLRPVLYADAEIPLSEHKPELLRYLDRMQPTGYGNRQAYFVSRNLKVTNYRLVGKEGAHLRLSVTDGWITYDGIAFQQGHWFEKMPTRIDTLHSFEENEYNGIKTLQLNIRDIKPTETAEETVR
jgi:single-stranded-DNA-specific exonuclease